MPIFVRVHPRPISDREDRSIDAATAAKRRPPVFAIGRIVIGLALRVYHSFQPMRYDEAVTYLYFATRPWPAVFAWYRYPNNHILHTALVKAGSMFLGNAPWAIRMPAFVFGVATRSLLLPRLPERPSRVDWIRVIEAPANSSARRSVELYQLLPATPR